LQSIYEVEQLAICYLDGNEYWRTKTKVETLDEQHAHGTARTDGKGNMPQHMISLGGQESQAVRSDGSTHGFFFQVFVRFVLDALDFFILNLLDIFNRSMSDHTRAIEDHVTRKEKPKIQREL
jgi:hypothetical protein